jgi:3-hydroxyisobutyrate dehydrogenase
MRIGFIGLGNVGAPLARNLQRAGHDLVVRDLDRKRADELLAHGARWAASPRALAEASEVVITSLPSPAAVSAVMEAGDGVLAGLVPGATWIEMSTTDEGELRRLAALAEAKGAATLEAPITGGCHRAKSGNISILVGGAAADVARCRPLLETMGGTVLHVGPLGQASVLKVITNMLAFVHLVALGEGLMLARKAGIDLGAAFAGIQASSGNSFVHETESQVILNGSYNIGFTMDLACKDLGLARGLGEALGVPLELASLVEATFDRARNEYGERAWSTQVVKLLEDACATDLRAPGFPAELTDDAGATP